jgi:radical SAM superfamily enzyme YgiQ (UPF0313 family)
MGGLHVTSLPEEALQHCTSVVVGEAEPLWGRLVADFRAGRLQAWYETDGSEEFDMADAPLPRYDLLDLPRYNRLLVQTARGCPHRCDFCASSILLTRKYKPKPVERIIAEVRAIKDLYETGAPFLEFADDNSFVNHGYWKDLLTQLKGRKFRWFTETDLSVAEDDELLGFMLETGCAQVLIGLESPVESGLHQLELRNDWKLKRFPRYREAIHTIQSHGITVNGCFVIGLDGQTLDIGDQVLAFVRETGLYEVQITILTPFPGTPLYERLEREGRLLEPRNWKKCSLFDINFRPARMTVDELHKRFLALGVELYSEEFTAWRRRTFRENLRKSRRQSRL